MNAHEQPGPDRDEWVRAVERRRAALGRSIDA
jgi:hypothetical protein